jgi:rhodanese-related sulfurtransferase
VIHEIDPREAHSLLDSGEALALDVRERWEWREAHIRHALHIPLDELAGRLDELPQGRPLVAVCRSGSRSGAVVQALRQHGYDVVNLAGGLVSWHAHDLPLETA